MKINLQKLKSEHFVTFIWLALINFIKEFNSCSRAAAGTLMSIGSVYLLNVINTVREKSEGKEMFTVSYCREVSID